MVGVAQSVEHWIVAPVVEGSIPFTHPISTNCPSSGMPRAAINKVAVGSLRAGFLFVDRRKKREHFYVVSHLG
jgi:hypothetical protein